MADHFIDTSVIIDLQRNRHEARAFFTGLEQKPIISVITVGELYTGVREKTERPRLEAFMEACVIIEITQTIAVHAGLLCRQYRHSHGVRLPDALVAASCLSMDATLYTHNARHFPMIEKLIVPYPA